jgi:DNA-binding winged helix-turn-helix (wHTH) protein
VIVRFGGFALDSERRQLRRGDADVHLTPKAFDLLVVLVAEAPRVVYKKELHERLWPDSFVAEATLVGLVKELRRALDDRDTTAPLIRTAHGVGYAFAGTVDGFAARLGPAVSHWVVVGGRRITLADGEHVIGRDPAVAIHVDSSGVSRRHARIVVNGSGAALEDLASKNGTRLNDRAIAGRAALHDGDQIQLGPAVVVFRSSTSGSSTETLAPVTRR